jgi:dihydrofolate synthase/folylpolyglutamate synthase
MLGTKDCEGYLRNFSGLARRVYAIPIPNQEKTLPAEAVAQAARNVGIPAERYATLEDALAAAGRLDLDPAPRILIGGSLYLAGDVLDKNGTPPT